MEKALRGLIVLGLAAVAVGLAGCHSDEAADDSQAPPPKKPGSIPPPSDLPPGMMKKGAGTK